MTTKKLTFRQKILVAGTLFGMFFGAGNLIFPVHLGQMAGRNAVVAMIGFIITAVGIPIFGVAAIGITHSDGLQTLSEQGRQGLRHFLYLPSVPDHRPALRHPEMRDRFVHDRHHAPAGRGFAGVARICLSFRRRSSPSCCSSRCAPVRSPSGSARSSIRSSCSSSQCSIIAALLSPGAAISSVEPTEAYQNGSFFRRAH